MNTEWLKNYKGETIVGDNNILTDFIMISQLETSVKSMILKLPSLLE